VAFLVWVYYSCAILFYGAEITRAICQQNGHSVKPKKTAVFVHKKTVEAEAAEVPN